MDHFIGRSKLPAACFCCIVILRLRARSGIRKEMSLQLGTFRMCDLNIMEDEYMNNTH